MRIEIVEKKQKWINSDLFCAKKEGKFVSLMIFFSRSPQKYFRIRDEHYLRLISSREASGMS